MTRDESLNFVFKKHLEDYTFEGNYARGHIDGEENLDKFLKDFEAASHIKFCVSRTENRTKGNFLRLNFLC